MATGALAGLIAGMLGLGGGVILVPALFYLFSHQNFPPQITMHMALATSMCCIIFTSSTAMVSHLKVGAIRWKLVSWLVTGMVLGALLGTFVIDGVSPKYLERGFSVFLLLIAIQIQMGSKRSVKNIPLKVSEVIPVGGVIGLVSAFFGIGGGSLTVPYLTNRTVPMAQAIAISATSALPMALAASLGFVISGLNEAGRPPWSLGYIYLPAVLCIVAFSMITAYWGAQMAHKLEVKLLRQIFSVVLLVVAADMLIG